MFWVPHDLVPKLIFHDVHSYYYTVNFEWRLGNRTRNVNVLNKIALFDATII